MDKNIGIIIESDEIIFKVEKSTKWAKKLGGAKQKWKQQNFKKNEQAKRFL